MRKVKRRGFDPLIEFDSMTPHSERSKLSI
jgi:hypothetical protein